MEDGNESSVRLQVWTDLSGYQLKIAKRWLEKGNVAEDIHAQFFFHFSGFNALYFLWRMIDNPGSTEKQHIENLLRKLGQAKAQEILEDLNESISFFCSRSPIQQMNRRSINSQEMGDVVEGQKWQDILSDAGQSSTERIVALGMILYLVRCNLVHGSKTDSGDDLHVIENSIKPIKVLLEGSIHITEQELPWLS
jgi:hypothetical protein